MLSVIIMRDDMFKVIVERPRWGRAGAMRTKLRYDRQPDRKHVTGKRMALEQRGWTKGLNENLAPLRRYLRKQVGRPWDKVYSEICQTLDTGSTVKQHVREHIEDFVLTKVRIDAYGQFFAATWYDQPEPPQHWRADMYVDPRDGLLKETRKLLRKLRLEPRREVLRRQYRARLNRQDELRLKSVSETRYHAQINGLWFEIDCNRRPCSRVGHPLQPEEIFTALETGAWREDAKWRVIRRKQLSKKEMAALGLMNRVEV